ncbi:MAG TPA: trypsin-like peptidase domain-containing protein, partial [Ilumatobacteraceae bacterium]|nr:trypsin-like peptidase domain-containing protein [Ilumatobacteraceae bacterium]
MMRRTLPRVAKTRLIGLLAVASLVAAGCGGGGDDEADTTEAPDDTEATDDTEAPDDTVADTAPETTTDTSGPQVGFDQVQPAVVQIIAKGTIRDPELGATSTAGSGTGFIISPDGIAVTNNHVVTGAATLEVYVGGELDRSFNAVVLGVSECNDLAVIDITEDEPLPFLEWYDGELAAGLEVYAAGFPLGDPEFTLTRGIVAKAQASGETPWASIDSTIEHDANIQPGNSGGPLVTAEGQVAAVNYATGSQTNTSQFFAISKELAEPVVERLMDGDFEALGINGQAVVDEEAGIAGIWVAGVAPGSPASETGILPGDIVTTLNGLPVGGDGTYSDYCDVLRTAGDRPITVEVL